VKKILFINPAFKESLHSNIKVLAIPPLNLAMIAAYTPDHYEVEIVDGGTSGMELLDALCGRDHVIVCDAIRSDAQPGSVQRIDGDRLAGFFATRISPHQLGLSEVLANLELLGERPKRLTIIGVVPEALGLGTELSAAGRRGMEQSIDFILEDLAALGVRPTREPLTAPEGA